MTESEQRNRLKIALPSSYHQALRDQGAPWSIFAERPFLLDQAVCNITYTPEKMQPQIIKKSEQINDFFEVMESPFLKPYIYIISGRPSDVRACCVAATLMIQASLIHAQLKSDKEHNPQSRFGKMERPLWVKLTNDYKDNMPSLHSKPSFLILSNLTPNSSNFKNEKLRDILECHDTIPRVIISNETDPLTFSRSKIFVKPHYVMMLDSNKKKMEL